MGTNPLGRSVLQNWQPQLPGLNSFSSSSSILSDTFSDADRQVERVDAAVRQLLGRKPRWQGCPQGRHDLDGHLRVADGALEEHLLGLPLLG